MQNVRGCTLGIFGRGAIGGHVAQMAEALGMKVLFAEHRNRPEIRAGYTRFETVLDQSDVISLHCPLTEATRGMIGHAEISRMKPSAMLINTARGGLVDEQALADSLRAGHLGGAAFDVLSEEPPRQGNPLLAGDIPRLIITPHNAWGSREARQRIVGQMAENASAFFAGAPVRVVG